MRVRRAEGHAIGLDAFLLVQPLGDFVTDIGWHPAIIHRDENRRAVLVAPESQRLGPELLGYALGFVFRTA